VALVLVLLSMLLVSALGMALMLVLGTETLVAAHHRDSVEALYAADAGLERALQEVITTSDWNTLLTSADEVRAANTCGFSDSILVFSLSGTSTVDLARETSALNCPQVLPRPAACAPGQMNAITSQRPWGANNPRWRLYAWGRLSTLVRTPSESSFVVAVWVADDTAEIDDNPARDGIGDASPGAGVIQVLALSFGPGGVRSSVAAAVSRTGGTGADHGYTAQRGDDERNQRRHGAGVQAPGSALGRRDVGISGQQSSQP
jgi:hypothetical protein